jgi:peptidyl-prolyl cis-trans isomerase D
MARGSSTISKSAVWVLLSLLILGLGGFGVTNLSGNVQSVGRVGDQEIAIDSYARELQQEIRAIEAQTRQPLPLTEARDMGIDRAVLARLVTTAALDHETASLGISVGDETVAEQIRDIPAFQGLSGGFDRDTYKFALDRAGLTEARFEEQLRRETARSALQGALLQGVAMPPLYSETLINYVAERRDFSFIRLDASALSAPLPSPTEAQLQAYHDENKAQFTTPQQKTITYAWLSPEAMLDQIDVPEDALRAEYEARSDTYNTPERRLVERLGFADEAAAQAAADAIAAGTTDFEALAAQRGLSLNDIDMGDVLPTDLGAAADTVFAAETGAVVGPIDSPVGPALFRVNAVLAAQNTSFDEAREELRTELAIDRARRLIETRATDIDGLLAGGATLEELQTEAGMQVATINWSPEVSDGIAGFAGFRQAASAVTREDFPTIEMLDDGGVFALRLDGEIAPQLQPLDSVRDAVLAGWQTQETTARLLAQAQDLVAEVAAGTDFEALGLPVTREAALTRQDFVPEVPRALLQQAFALQPGDLAVVEAPAQAYVLRLDAILPPDMADEAVTELAARLQAEADQAMTEDLFRALAANIQERVGITLDQAAINAVHANFQ